MNESVDFEATPSVHAHSAVIQFWSRQNGFLSSLLSTRNGAGKVANSQISEILQANETGFREKFWHATIPDEATKDGMDFRRTKHSVGPR